MSEHDPTRLIVVRHGESDANAAGRIGGSLSCTGLSDLGRQQAQRLRDRLAVEMPAVDELWASTMPRAEETATILNEALQLELQTEHEFEEFRPGEADGMLYSDYTEKYGTRDSLAEPYRKLSPGGESRADFFLRVSSAFDEFLAARAGKSLMVVCHGGVVDVLFRQLLGVDREAPFELWTTNTSVSEFVTTNHGPPRRWRLARYNDTAHLHGLPPHTTT